MSIVSAGPYRDGVAFMTMGNSAKLANLKRNNRCSLLVSKHDWSQYVVLEGRAYTMSPDNTHAEELRAALRDVYRSAVGEHGDWEEFDESGKQTHMSVVIVVPEHTYGMLRE